MAFDNVVFPYYPMKHGISKTVSDPVTVITNGSYEYRIKRQAWERYSWTLPTQTMTNEQKEAIKSFLSQRNSSLNSFKFNGDPDAISLVEARLSHHSGQYWNLNLPYSMADQSIPGTHPLFNADVDNWTITENGGPTTIVSAGSPNIPLQYIAGQPVIHILGTYGTEDIRVTGDIHFTVRLGSTISYVLEALNTSNETLGVNTGAIELVEVFGEY